jgi:hypothetical protein
MTQTGKGGKAAYDLGRAGVLVRVAGGMYRLEESVRGYCEHLRHRTAKPVTPWLSEKATEAPPIRCVSLSVSPTRA